MGIKSTTPFSLSIGKTKPFLTIDSQLDLLISRGLIVNNRENALNILRRTNYYRFSAYSLTLRKNDVFDPNVTFDDIYELYRFDDAFRKIIFQYSQYVETSLRSYLAYEFSGKYGALGYMDSKNFADSLYHVDFIAKLQEEIEKSDDVFVAHYRQDFNSVFPMWVAIECTTFGNLSKLYKNLKVEDRTTISKKYFGTSREYVENWLQAAVFARNVSAHGGRFYNRKLRTVPVKLPQKYSGIIDGRSAFAYAYAIYKMQPTKALSAAMRKALSDIWASYPFALKTHVGFSEDWEQILVDSENTKAF